jgi:hypothetical protein
MQPDITKNLDSKLPINQIPFELTFSKHGNGVPYFAEGFSVPEPWGTWTVSDKARLSIPLALSVPLRLIIRFQLFARPNAPPAGFTLAVNSVVCGEFGPERSKWGEVFEYPSTIPPQLARSGHLDIEFQIRNGRNVSGKGGDDRPLGIGLRSITLVAEENLTLSNTTDSSNTGTVQSPVKKMIQRVMHLLTGQSRREDGG